MVANRAVEIASEIEAEARLDLMGYAGRSLGGALLSVQMSHGEAQWSIGSRRITRDRAVAMLRRYHQPPPRDGIPGPNPLQGDWLDPRWRGRLGNPSAVIPFQRPGWVLERHWDAFRKAAARRSTYQIAIEVRPTLTSLRQYICHLLAEELADALLSAHEAPAVSDAEELVWARGLSEREQAQYQRYRAMGLEPFVWLEPRGSHMVVAEASRARFEAWRQARLAARKAARQ